jgi:hypothetical protein
MKEKLTFGRGFREISTPVKISLFPSQAPKEIAPEIDVTETFRFEEEGDDDCSCVRVRSDISMLFHAADMSKRIGVNGMQYLMNTKRPKTSAFQNQLDSLNLSDDELLSMVKSRHVQSPSEVLDWVNSINELASELESEALKLAADEQKVDTSSVDGSVDTGLSGSASS